MCTNMYIILFIDRYQPNVQYNQPSATMMAPAGGVNMNQGQPMYNAGNASQPMGPGGPAVDYNTFNMQSKFN